MKLACPKCESDDVRKCSVIYQQGTATSVQQSSTVGVADTPGGWAVGGAATTTKGSQQSLLAQQVAPPPQREITAGGLFVGAAMISVVSVLLMFLDFTAGLVVCLVFGAIAWAAYNA